MKRLLPTCLLAVTSFTGCSSSDTPTADDYDDVAQALTAVTVTDDATGDTGAMADAATIARGDGKLALKIDANGKYSGNHLGFNYNYTAACSDAAGAAQEACDRNTDKADIAVNWSGELKLPRLTATVMRDGNWELRNLQTDEVTFAGDSDFSLDAQLQSLFRSVTRTYKVSYSANYNSVVFDRDTHSFKSGTVTYTIDAERTATGSRGDSEAQFDIDGELTFNGNGTAKLTLDKKASYNVNLTNGELTKADGTTR
jgi:hypothetical protein